MSVEDITLILLSQQLSFSNKHLFQAGREELTFSVKEGAVTYETALMKDVGLCGYCSESWLTVFSNILLSVFQDTFLLRYFSSV